MISTQQLALCAFALCLSACGDEAEPLSEVEPLCDGSGGPRLTYAATPGFGQPGDAFTAAHGEHWLVVTGSCEYVLADGTLRGLRTGLIDSGESEALAEALHLGRYALASDFVDEPCADAGRRVLVDGSGRLTRVGCGDEAAPRIWREAFDEVWRLFLRLEGSALPDWTATRLLAVRPLESPRADAVQDWPADLDLEAIAIDAIDLTRNLQTFEGVSVRDAPTLSLLSELRRAALRANDDARALYVRDSSSRLFQIFLRDEPPPEIASAIRAALQP
jgi:hypothetical protein